jgi:hypothetical protein
MDVSRFVCTCNDAFFDVFQDMSLRFSSLASAMSLLFGVQALPFIWRYLIRLTAGKTSQSALTLPCVKGKVNI